MRKFEDFFEADDNIEQVLSALEEAPVAVPQAPATSSLPAAQEAEPETPAKTQGALTADPPPAADAAPTSSATTHTTTATAPLPRSSTLPEAGGTRGGEERRQATALSLADPPSTPERPNREKNPPVGAAGGVLLLLCEPGLLKAAAPSRET